MKVYKRIWEQYHDMKLPDNKEIHHIDGNHNNNDPTNLLAVTIEEHLEIHRNQKDYGAVQAILMRMNRTQEEHNELIDSASKHQQQLWEEGKHNFQKISDEERKKISTTVGEYTRDNLLGIHKINADPNLSKANSSNGGKHSYAKKAGFHARPYQKESVGGTSWWIDDKGNRKRSKEQPNENFRKGMR